MNYRGEVTLPFGDGEHVFKLTVAGVLELEDKTKSPFAVVFQRVAGGSFAFSDIYETLRLGLIGGGMAALDARKLADRYAMPLSESAPIARLVLAGVMFGFEDQPSKKAEAAPMQESTSASSPPTSSPTQTSSESGLMSLEEFHSSNWWPH